MKKLYRSTENKKIAGIFGGLGEIFNIDPTLLRLIFVFIGLATVVIPLVVAYWWVGSSFPRGKGLLSPRRVKLAGLWESAGRKGTAWLASPSDFFSVVLVEAPI